MANKPDDPVPTGQVRRRRAPAANVARPRLGRLLARGMTLGCAACGARGHFRLWLRMEDRCHRCGLVFERIEGHWLGAIGLNTIFSFGVLLVSLIVSVALTLPDIPVRPLMIANMALAAGFPLVFHPFSRTIWTAVDVAMRPLEPHEVDWAAIGTDLPEGSP